MSSSGCFRMPDSTIIQVDWNPSMLPLAILTFCKSVKLYTASAVRFVW